MIAGGAAALINFLITSPPSFISPVRETEEEIQVEAFHPPELIRSFPTEKPGFGAPWSSCASLHLQAQRSSRRTWLLSLSWLGWCPRHPQDSCWRRNQPTDSMEPSVLLKICVTCVILCHPAGTQHPLDDEEGQILVGMMSFGPSISGVAVWGARISCQRGQDSVFSQIFSI